MRRRDFNDLISFIIVSSAVTWPRSAPAQSIGTPLICFLNSQSAGPAAAFVAAFGSGLREVGYREGRDVRVEYSWAEGDDQRVKALMAELVKRRPDVIVATGGIRSAQAAQETTSTIPTLFISGSNPVQLGLVASINRPGRNLTGVSLDTTEMVPKRLEALRDLLPSGSKIAMLVSLDSDHGGPRSSVPNFEMRFAESQGVLVLRIRNPERFDEELDDELGVAFKNGARGLLVSAEPFFTVRRRLIVALAAKHKLAALYPLRPYVDAGGLASYGPDLVDVYHQIGIYAGRILRGAKPDELPVIFPRKWDFVLNLKTAKALGLQIPSEVRARANETID